MARTSKDRIACEFYIWNLFERDGTWYADGRGNQPRLAKYSLGTRDRAEALSQLKKLDRCMAARAGVIEAALDDSRSDDGVSINDGWSRFTEYVARPAVVGGATLTTQKRYRAVRDKHQGFSATRGIQNWLQVDKSSLLAYAGHLSKADYAPATIFFECSLVMEVMKFLIEEAKLLPESQKFQLKLERPTESSAYCPTREEVTAMIDLCRSSPPLNWLSNILLALATTGMRIGELEPLRWSDIDLAVGVIVLPDTRNSARHRDVGAVRTTKGKRSRRIPVHCELRALLESLARRRDGLVFTGPRDGRVSGDVVRKTIKDHVLAALKTRFPTLEGEVGFEHFTPHCMRHYFVSQCFLQGASEGEVREWVGHADSRIVERYRHLRTADARMKMDKIEFVGRAAKDESGVLKRA